MTDLLKNSVRFKGFTLLEVLIAIFLFAVILSILYPSYTGTFRNIETAQSQSEIYHMARVALQRITEDLQSAYLPEHPGASQPGEESPRRGFLGQDATLDGRAADGLQFASEEHIPFHDGDRKGRGHIIYYVKEKEDMFTLYRSDTPEFENPPGEGTGGFVVFEGLYSIDITYQDEEGETYDQWDSSTEPFKNKLPVLVSVQIECMDPSEPNSPIRFMSSVALPMAENNS